MILCSLPGFPLVPSNSFILFCIHNISDGIVRQTLLRFLIQWDQIHGKEPRKGSLTQDNKNICNTVTLLHETHVIIECDAPKCILAASYQSELWAIKVSTFYSNWQQLSSASGKYLSHHLLTKTFHWRCQEFNLGPSEYKSKCSATELSRSP